jgi:hypothetical protein
MVESQPSKLLVAGSIPVSRSKSSTLAYHGRFYPRPGKTIHGIFLGCWSKLVALEPLVLVETSG